MGRRRSAIPLSIFLNGRLVGVWAREASGATRFAYDPSWLDWENTLPISLSLPLRSDRYVGTPAITVFDNLLPDNEILRRRVAERVGAVGTDTHSLLSMIGRDCIGALQFIPEGEEPKPYDQLNGEPLNEEQVAALLKNLDVTPLGIRRENDLRISVAGTQGKTALLYHKGHWIAPSGTTPTTHIIKPQIGRLPNGMNLTESVENEFLCLKLMENYGLRMAQAEMTTFNDQKALVIERFDRLWTGDGRLIRLPQEDMCQALSVPPTRKHQSEGGPGITDIMNVLLGSDEPTRDRLDFFKANVLFWLIGATDGHAKNFSIGLFPGGRFRMTPFYDVLTVQPTVDAREIERKAFRLAMRMGKSNHYRVGDIIGRHIMQTGVDSGLSRNTVAELFEQIHQQTEAAIDQTYQNLPEGFPISLFDSVAVAMTDRLRRLKWTIPES